MAEVQSRFAAITEKPPADGSDGSLTEIDAKEFRRARRDPRLRRFARAADERLGKLRARGQID